VQLLLIAVNQQTAVQTLLKKDGSVANRQELNMVLQAIKAISINPSNGCGK
jgi:hypothetical protein